MFKPRVTAILILTLILVGCTQNDQKPVTVNYQTMEETNLGYIIRIGNTDKSILEKNFSGNFKPIDASQGLYHVNAKSEIEISNVLPNAKINPNLILSSKEKEKDTGFEWLASELKGSGPTFANCKDGEDEPTPAIKLLNKKDLKLRKGYFDRHQVLRLSGSESSEKSMSWFVKAPGERQPRGPLSHDAEFEVRLEELGYYEIGLLVQNSRGTCAILVAPVKVSANPKYQIPNPKVQTLLGNMEQKFDHLKQINAEKAWETSQGEDQIIAVLDSGVNYNHPFLNANILVNEKEIPDNGIDDDGNELVDDYIGWDYAQDDGAPFDDIGHGSHVAGLAAAEVFGVAPKAKILPIKVVSETGMADMARATAAIYYAVHRGAKILNLSFGGPVNRNASPESIQPVLDAFEYANKNGVIIVTAAGNGTVDQIGNPIRIDIDIIPHLPASLPILNNIAVASIDEDLNLAPYSNFGARSVRVAAPGGTRQKPLLSAKQDNSKGELFWAADGTSMAAPVTAGVIALMRGANPKLSVAEINQILLTSGPETKNLLGKLQSGRALDALEAVNKAKR